MYKFDSLKETNLFSLSKAKYISQELSKMDIGPDFELTPSLHMEHTRVSAWMSPKQIWKDQLAKADLYSKVDPNKNQRADIYFPPLHVLS